MKLFHVEKSKERTDIGVNRSDGLGMAMHKGGCKLR